MTFANPVVGYLDDQQDSRKYRQDHGHRRTTPNPACRPTACCRTAHLRALLQSWTQSGSMCQGERIGKLYVLRPLGEQVSCSTFSADRVEFSLTFLPRFRRRYGRVLAVQSESTKKPGTPGPELYSTSMPRRWRTLSTVAFSDTTEKCGVATLAVAPKS